MRTNDQCVAFYSIPHHTDGSAGRDGTLPVSRSLRRNSSGSAQLGRALSSPAMTPSRQGSASSMGIPTPASGLPERSGPPPSLPDAGTGTNGFGVLSPPGLSSAPSVAAETPPEGPSSSAAAAAVWGSPGRGGGGRREGGGSPPKGGKQSGGRSASGGGAQKRRRKASGWGAADRAEAEDDAEWCDAGERKPAAATRVKKENKVVKKAPEEQLWAQCDACGKWRRLPKVPLITQKPSLKTLAEIQNLYVVKTSIFR